MATYARVIMISFLVPMVLSRCVQFFRQDYTYFEEFDRFYKIHLNLDGYLLSKAFMSCENEGAKLFHPKTVSEWTVVENLMTSINKSTVFAIVGMSGVYGLNDFVSNDGTPTHIQMNLTSDGVETTKQCVLINMNTKSYLVEPCVKTSEKKLAYICEKVPSKNPCPTIDPGYKYSQSARKCYKLNDKARSWPEAWRTCIMEGASLAVVSNRAEADALMGLMSDNTAYAVGFAKMNNFFYTIKGSLLENEPDLPWYEDQNDDCGALYVVKDRNIENNRQNMYGYTPNQPDGLYKTTRNCNMEHPFICELDSK